MTMVRLLFWILLALPLPIQAQSCVELNSKIDQDNIEISKITDQLKELEGKFQRSVIDDFVAITEGILDEIHRNTALKMAYARKKLRKTLDLRRASLALSRTDFCSRCGMSAKNESAKALYCAKCPEGPGC